MSETHDGNGTGGDRSMTNTYNGSSGEVAIFVNPHLWHIGGRLAAALQTCELALASSPDITASLKEEVRQRGERLADLFLVLVPLPATRVSEQTQALNAWSLPLRRGRWLSVWPADDCPDEHAVVVWGQDDRPMSLGGELRCICGRPVTVTATDVFCASGHTIDAAV